MGLFSIFDVSGSAMSAQTVRLNTVASNMANSEVVSSTEAGAYHARQPVFSAVMKAIGGDPAIVPVEISGIVESDAPLRREYQPHHPLADEQGYVFMPNVNVVEEMANMISASRGYETSIEVMEASKRMLQQTLALGQ